MRIALSINAILAQIYAQSALRFAISGQTASVLTENDRAAIRALTVSAASRVCLALLPVIVDTNITDADLTDPASESDLLTFDISDEANINLPAAGLLGERVIISTVLAELYAGCDDKTTSEYSTEAETLHQRLRSLVAAGDMPSLPPFP